MGLPKGRTNGTPFVKGDPRINRQGRKKNERTLTKELQNVGDEIVEYEGEQMPRYKALAKVVWKKCMAGDEKLIPYLYNRLDGKPKETIDLTQKMIEFELKKPEIPQGEFKLITNAEEQNIVDIDTQEKTS